MKHITFILLATVLLISGCGEKAGPEKPKKEKTAPTPSLILTKKDVEPNKCKICDFDIAKYKGELGKLEIEGLLLALNDEYLAKTIYEGVNKKFDNPRPFSNVVEAEEKHSEMLVGLFEKYKVPVPENPWPGDVPEYDSVVSACEAAASAEVVNAALYEQLFASTNREDIKTVYKSLQRASQENHRPAFERCADNGGGNGNGRGREKNQ